MKNTVYKNEIDSKNLLDHKENLVDKTINKDLTKYEIIKELLEGLQKETKQLKVILFEDLSVSPAAKEKAEKISRIAFQLQACLNVEKGGELAANLMWTYRYIRYMAKTVQENESMNYVKPASQVIDTLVESWNTIPEDKRY